MTRIKQLIIFWKLHSFTITTLVGFAVCLWIARILGPGSWAYDTWQQMAGIFGTGIALLLAKFTYEKDADPTKPPKHVAEDPDLKPHLEK